jgi:hypothetical protein
VWSSGECDYEDQEIFPDDHDLARMTSAALTLLWNRKKAVARRSIEFRANPLARWRTFRRGRASDISDQGRRFQSRIQATNGS